MVERVVNFQSEELPLPASRERDLAEKRNTDAAKLLTIGQRRHLRHGRLYPGETGFETLEEFRAAWDRHGNSIMSDWRASRPSTRPAAWWVLSFPCAEKYPASDNPLHFGKFIPRSEDQPSILAIHDLLSEDELQAQRELCETI